jgi:hypothetical protein
MKYVMRKSYVDVIGKIWTGGTAAMRYDVHQWEIEQMRSASGLLTRESVSLWLDVHSGDFASITDFSASLEPAIEGTVDIPWANPDSEMTFNDCMFTEE